MALALDGTPVSGNSGSSNSFALPGFSNTQSNTIVYAAIVSNGGPVTSIDDTAGLTWTLRARADDGTAAEVTELWSAKSSGILTNNVITIHTTSADFITAFAASFSGENFTTPFDPNAAIPVSLSGSGNCTFTTTNSDDILICAGRSGAGSGSVDAPFTQIFAVNFARFGYQIVAAPQAASSFTIDGNVRTCAGSVGDAIVQDTGGGDVLGVQTMRFM